jgi:hypothetical protein
MHRYIISEDATAEDLEPVAMALHHLLSRLPVTARSRNRPGIRIEDGKVMDSAYSGPVLEEVLGSGEPVKSTPRAGPYRGIPVVVTPVRAHDGEVIAAIGVVDITGIFDLATLMEHQSTIIRQICGSDPCPLPSERPEAKR